MPAEEFEKTSLPWQFDRSVARFFEWLEGQFDQIDPSLPRVSLPEGFWQFLQVCSLILVGGLVLWLGWLLLRWLLRNYVRPTTTRAMDTTSKEQLDAKDFRSRASTLAAQGRYVEACQCLYQAMVQLLNERKIVPAQPGRTGREYREQLATTPRATSSSTLATEHERLLFAMSDADKDTFERCERALNELEAIR